MNYPYCDYFKEEISDWSGLIICEKNSSNKIEKIRIFCRPAILILNEEYDGWNKYKKIWSLKQFRNDFENIKKETDFTNWSEEAKYQLEKLFKLAKQEQRELGYGTLEGPGDYWLASGYQYEDDFYLDHYGCLKSEWFQKHFDEWTTYYRFFQLLQRMIMKTEGPDHRYFLNSSFNEKEKELDSWLEKLSVFKQKKGYESTKKEVLEEIHYIFKGEKTVEQVLFNVRSILSIFLKKYELVDIDLIQTEEYDEKDREGRKNKQVIK